MTVTSIAKQGQSDATEFKERGLELTFFINLRVFTSKFGNSKYRYWHFDLNSGSGVNKKIGCIGSPLAFIRAAQSVNCKNYLAAFCDKEGEYIKQLKHRDGIVNNPNAVCFHGDNAALIESIPDIIEYHGNDKCQHAMGMVLSDPNGFEVPLAELSALSQQCPKIDIAIHWNSRIRRLYRGKGWDFVDIDEAIAMLNKQHWLIRKPLGAYQWTVLVGRNNVKIGDHRALGFYHLDSEEGQEILHKCKARLKAMEELQLPLLGNKDAPLPELSRVSRSLGISRYQENRYAQNQLALL